MPNRPRKNINIETPERNCTKQTQQYGTQKYAEKDSLHPTTYPLIQPIAFSGIVHCFIVLTFNYHRFLL
jgi:hypothetical protein